MNDGVRYVCNRCGVKYKKSNVYILFNSLEIIFNFLVSALRSHVRECGIGAQCPLCPKVVTQKRNLAKHMEKHKRDGLWENSYSSNDMTENYNIINIKEEISL